FRVSSTIPRYISAGDLLTLGKAVVASNLITAMVLFTITRLNGIPPAVPAIHALVLGAGLLASRGLANIVARHRDRRDPPRNPAMVNLILIGLNDWSVFLVKFFQAYAPDRWRVIALLDENREGLAARSMACRFSGRPHICPAQLRAYSRSPSAFGISRAKRGT